MTAELPDTKWVTGLSYVPTAQGSLYLTVILDLCCKGVVGLAADTRLLTNTLAAVDAKAATGRVGVHGTTYLRNLCSAGARASSFTREAFTTRHHTQVDYGQRTSNLGH